MFVNREIYVVFCRLPLCKCLKFGAYRFISKVGKNMMGQIPLNFRHCLVPKLLVGSEKVYRFKNSMDIPYPLAKFDSVPPLEPRQETEKFRVFCLSFCLSVTLGRSGLRCADSNSYIVAVQIYVARWRHQCC